ncbi:DUF2835 family protein [Litorilituus sediminis]|uniref:DUF2835 family protein n=2 Tax=Litorilituus sediminis TaxID=718192 RepID=A0A4P6P263_9GAMM|nr:DUF2835 family protein [Litorilituus sediminis]
MKYFFSIRMSIDEFMPYYEGRASTIIVITDQGLKVQFPAMHLRKYITRQGIIGNFCLETHNNKFLSLTKLK